MTSPTTVVEPFDQALAALRKRLSDADAVCRAVVPAADGSLRFDWLGGGRRTSIILRPAVDNAQRPPGVMLRLGSLELVAHGAGPVDAQAVLLARRVRAALLDEWRRSLGTWLAWGVAPRDAMSVRQEVDGLMEALAPKFGAGVSFWHGWHLARVYREADPDGLRWRLVFEHDAHGDFVVALGDVPRGARQFMETALGHASSCQAGSAGGTALCALEGVIGFLLGRCLPAGTHWAPPAAPLSAEDVAREGLVQGCFRGSVQSGARPSRFFGLWGFPDSFGLGVEFARYRAAVLHASRECPLLSRVLTGSLSQGVRPWGAEATRPAGEELAIYTTDLDETSLALGGEDKLARLFRWLGAEAGDVGPAGVLLAEGCESHMVGDRPQAVGEACLHGTGLGLTFLQSRQPNFEEADTRSAWARLLDEAARVGQAGRRARAVSLVGLGDGAAPEMADLRTRLSELGIEVACVVMPGVDAGATQGLAAAELAVASPWEPVREVFTRPMAARGLPFLELAAPYGLEGTIRWASSVCAALGLPAPDGAVRDRWRGYLAEMAAPAIDALGGEPLHLAFVLDGGTLGEFLSPSFFFGADPLEVGSGEGLALTVAHVPPAGEWRRTDLADVERVRAHGARFVEYAPGTPVDEVLAELAPDMVYCDTGDGAVIKRAGAIPVGIRTFSPGLWGQARTLNRLAAMRRMRLYRRHGHRL